MPVTTREKWYIGAIAATALVGGAMWFHPGRPAPIPAPVVYIPYQAPWLERYQTLVSGVFTFLGGIGALGAGFMAYRGTVRAAEINAKAFMDERIATIQNTIELDRRTSDRNNHSKKTMIMAAAFRMKQEADIKEISIKAIEKDVNNFNFDRIPALVINFKQICNEMHFYVDGQFISVSASGYTVGAISRLFDARNQDLLAIRAAREALAQISNWQKKPTDPGHFTYCMNLLTETCRGHIDMVQGAITDALDALTQSMS